MKPAKKTCRTCGIEFETVFVAAKYCSLACKYRALEGRKIKNNRVVYHRVCRTCGKKFTTLDAYKRFCTRDCNQRLLRYSLVCEICGNPFMSMAKKQRTCSIKCKKQLLQNIRRGDTPAHGRHSSEYASQKHDIHIVKRAMAKCPRCGISHEYIFEFGFSGDVRTLRKYCPECTRAVKSCSDIACLINGGVTASNLCVAI